MATFSYIRVGHLNRCFPLSCPLLGFGFLDFDDNHIFLVHTHYCKWGVEFRIFAFRISEFQSSVYLYTLLSLEFHDFYSAGPTGHCKPCAWKCLYIWWLQIQPVLRNENMDPMMCHHRDSNPSNPIDCRHHCIIFFVRHAPGLKA